MPARITANLERMGLLGLSSAMYVQDLLRMVEVEKRVIGGYSGGDDCEIGRRLMCSWVIAADKRMVLEKMARALCIIG